MPMDEALDANEVLAQMAQAGDAPAVPINTCCFCEETFEGWGHNPHPILHGRVVACDECNVTIVLPQRIRMRRE